MKFEKREFPEVEQERLVLEDNDRLARAAVDHFMLSHLLESLHWNSQRENAVFRFSTQEMDVMWRALNEMHERVHRDLQLVYHQEQYNREAYSNLVIEHQKLKNDVRNLHKDVNAKDEVITAQSEVISQYREDFNRTVVRPDAQSED
jgi:hypothetical protein